MDFKSLVISNYPDLPNLQKRVADFFLSISFIASPFNRAVPQGIK